MTVPGAGDGDDVYANAFDAAAKEAAGDAASPARDQIPPPSDPPPVAEPASAAPDAGGGASPEADPSGPAEAAPVADPAPAGDAGGTPPAEADKPGGEASAPEPAAPPAQPSADDIVKGLADLLKQPQAPEAAPAPETPAPADIYTAEEAGRLQEFHKNWPDVADAFALMQRSVVQDMAQYIFKEVASYYAPYMDQLAAIGNHVHLSEVRQGIPDYNDDLETRVNAWIETQPDYLQVGMKQVMQSGTAAQVQDLARRYREAAGSPPPAAATPQPGAPALTPPKVTEPSDDAKKAASSLAPVSTDRTSVPQDDSALDYASAFEKYAGQALT